MTPARPCAGLVGLADSTSSPVPISSQRPPPHADGKATIVTPVPPPAPDRPLTARFTPTVAAEFPAAAAALVDAAATISQDAAAARLRVFVICHRTNKIKCELCGLDGVSHDVITHAKGKKHRRLARECASAPGVATPPGLKMLGLGPVPDLTLLNVEEAHVAAEPLRHVKQMKLARKRNVSASREES